MSVTLCACCVFLQRGDVHTLFIPEVFYEDSGKFSVRAVNKAGQATSTAELIVEGRLLRHAASRRVRQSTGAASVLITCRQSANVFQIL